MRYRGKHLDPIALWSNYVEIRDDRINGEFLPLTYCPNPDHPNTHTPAFQINVERPLVHCFSHCGISGSYKWAIAQIEGISVQRAEKIILRQLRGYAPRERPARSRAQTKQEIQREINLHDYSYLPPDALAYLEERKITDASVAKWEIGFDVEEQRLVIPAYDERNRLRFLIRRAIHRDDYPKYLYDEDADVNSLLFGYRHLGRDRVRSEGLILVEGSLDAIKLYQHGLTNTVGILGSSISDRQFHLIDLLRPRRIYFMFDRDSAGVRVLEEGIRNLPSVPKFVCRYARDRFDPAEMTRKEALRSVEKAITVTRFNRIKKGISIGPHNAKL
jgi:DNA primase